MTQETQRAALEGRFKTQWDSTHPTMEVGYSEHKFEFIEGTTSVRLTIANGKADQMSFGDPGSNLVRHVGVLFVEIAVPGGKGLATLNPLEDEVMDLYRNETFGGVRCRVPYVAGHREQVPFLISTVAIPFERDEHNG